MSISRSVNRRRTGTIIQSVDRRRISTIVRLVRRSLAYRHDHCLVVIAGVSALSFGRTVGVAAQSLSVWGSSTVPATGRLGSSTVQASGGDSRRIGTIIVWFMVDVVGVSTRRVIGFGFVSQAYRHESNLDRRHTGTIIRSVVVVIFRICGVRQGPIGVLAKTLF